MHVQRSKRVLFLLCTLLLAGFQASEGLSYNYTANIECLTRPEKPQYGGGIIINPELEDGLDGWSTFGAARIEHRESEGNRFVVSHARSQPYDSCSQKLYLDSGKLYAFSAWIQVSEGDVPVTAVFKTSSGFKHAGAIVAQSKCWSMLKGGLTVDASGPAELFFESKNTSVEIWADSISLQPFTQEQWKAHQDENIQKARKRTVRIQAVDEEGTPLANATISIQQRRPGFPLGCAINKNILTNSAYQNWFTSRFKVTTFEDEMKWYSNEYSQGHEDYSAADAMLRFAKQHNIVVRGHNIFWDDPRYQPSWVNSLSPSRLSAAAHRRVNSIVSRYKGQVIAWDVVNENLHFSFFESKLGDGASGMIYDWTMKADGSSTPLFMNEYNTIEDSRDGQSTPARYLQKLKKIKSYPGHSKGHFGIGLEGHFSTPNIPYMRSAIDTLGASGLPVWLTEIDVGSSPNQAEYLEDVLREAFAHPKVSGIVIWAAWKPSGCYRMCLTDNNFRNLATGYVVDELLHEWGFEQETEGKTDADGFFEASLFHGEYAVKITHPALRNLSLSHSLNLKVEPADAVLLCNFELLFERNLNVSISDG